MRSRISIALFSSFLLVAGVLLGTAQATNNCSGPQDRTSYTVQICITAPDPSITPSITGDVHVTATVQVTGTNPGIDSVSFRLKGQGAGGLGVYALTDQTGSGPTDFKTFGFVLPSYRWPDGQRSLIARATMLDTYTTNPGANVVVTFSNPLGDPSDPRSFFPRTPAPAGDHPNHLVVAAVGDGAIDNQQALDASNEVAAINPDMFLYLGDVYNVGSLAEYYNWYGSPPGTNSSGSLGCPGPQGCGNWGRFYTITNPAAGVHEYNAPPIPDQPSGTTETGYVDYWGMPTGPDATGNVVRHYYSYNAGDCTAGGSPCWHFISLDSTDSFRCRSDGSACSGGGSSAGWATQYTWLQQTLQDDQQQDTANNTTGCTVAYWHHPYWGMKSRDEDGVTIAGGVDVRLTDMYQLMYQNGVDILLTGHQHNFQRWQPLDASGTQNSNYGITEIVDGAGGHPYGYFTRSDSRLAAGIDRSGDAFEGTTDLGQSPNGNPAGVIDLNLYNDHADYSYRLAGNPNDGAVADSASIPCHSAPPDSTPPGAPSTPQAVGGVSRVDLSWSPSSGNDIAGYNIFRATGAPASCTSSCVLVGSTDGTGTSFTDTNVKPSTVYTYAIRARDTSGNVSPESDSTTVSTASSSLFSDNFEAGTCSGPVTGWTKVSHMTKTPTTDGHGGACEADFQSTGTNIYASETLAPPQSDLWAQARFRLDSQSTPVSVLKFRSKNGTDTPFVYTAAVQKNGNLSGRNELLNKTTKSSRLVADGAWHLLTVHITTGASANVDVFLDGNPVSALSGTNAVGSDPIGTVQIGDNAGNRTFSGALDDIQVDTNPLSP